MNSITSVTHQIIALVVITAIKWAVPHTLNWLKSALTSETTKRKLKTLLNSHLWLAVIEFSFVIAVFVWVEVYFAGSEPATRDDLRHCFLAGFWVITIGALGGLDWMSYRIELGTLRL